MPLEGWEHKTLEAVCPPECLQKLIPALNKNSTAADYKAILVPYREQLEANGVVPEYLAYYLEHSVKSGEIIKS